MKPFHTYQTIGVICCTDSFTHKDFILHDSTEIYVGDITVTGYNTRIHFRSDTNYDLVGYFDIRNEFYDTTPNLDHMLKAT